jgi:hypothetical protein
MIRIVTFIMLAPVTCLSLAADSLASDGNKPWLMPFDIGRKYQSDPALLQPSQRQVYEFAWDSFVALNWPYLRQDDSGQPGMRGQPDASADAVSIYGMPTQCGDSKTTVSPAVVWETYMVPGDVFIEDPDPENYPVIWSVPEFLDLETGHREFRPKQYRAPYNRYFADGINQPYTHANVPTGPVVDQNGNYLRYEVTLNQTYFNYIRDYKYFSADVQKAAVRKFLEYAWKNDEAPPTDDPAYFQPVPIGTESYVPKNEDYARQGLVEVKAAWKILELKGDTPDIPERFFRRCLDILLPDGSNMTRLVGLVGFHIHRVTPNGHLPSTFEQIDNVELHRRRDDPLALPETPNLNPGPTRFSYEGSKDTSTGMTWPRHPGQRLRRASYPNGYEVNGLSGQPGLIPLAFLADEPLPPKDERPVINVSRVTPIPAEVQQVNRKYQRRWQNSVWRYYQLIGTQNKSGTSEGNPSVPPNPDIGPGIPNSDLGPGVPGPQYSMTSSLVNTTLESYTQGGWSCARCHINAFPQGVEVFPPFEKQFQDLHVMSFLLQNAK